MCHCFCLWATCIIVMYNISTVSMQTGVSKVDFSFGFQIYPRYKENAEQDKWGSCPSSASRNSRLKYSVLHEWNATVTDGGVTNEQECLVMAGCYGLFLATSFFGTHRVLGQWASSPDDFFFFMEPRDTSEMLWILARCPITTTRVGGRVQRSTITAEARRQCVRQLYSNILKWKRQLLMFHRCADPKLNLFWFPLNLLRHLVDHVILPLQVRLQLSPPLIPLHTRREYIGKTYNI